MYIHKGATRRRRIAAGENGLGNAENPEINKNRQKKYMTQIAPPPQKNRQKNRKNEKYRDANQLTVRHNAPLPPRRGKPQTGTGTRMNAGIRDNT